MSRNIRNIYALAELLKSLPARKFEMNTWLNRNSEKEDHLNSRGDVDIEVVREYHDKALKKGKPFDCKTVGCIAGWCQLVFAKTKMDFRLDPDDFAREFLGLDDDDESADAENLFTPDVVNYNSYRIKLDKKKAKKLAIEQLHRLAEGKHINSDWLDPANEEKSS
jgi:hypothetical protein